MKETLKLAVFVVVSYTLLMTFVYGVLGFYELVRIFYFHHERMLEYRAIDILITNYRWANTITGVLWLTVMVFLLVWAKSKRR